MNFNIGMKALKGLLICVIKVICSQNWALNSLYFITHVKYANIQMWKNMTNNSLKCIGTSNLNLKVHWFRSLDYKDHLGDLMWEMRDELCKEKGIVIYDHDLSFITYHICDTHLTRTNEHLHFRMVLHHVGDNIRKFVLMKKWDLIHWHMWSW